MYLTKEDKESIQRLSVLTILLAIAAIIIAYVFGRAWYEGVLIAIAIQIIRVAFARER